MVRWGYAGPLANSLLGWLSSKDRGEMGVSLSDDDADESPSDSECRCGSSSRDGRSDDRWNGESGTVVDMS